MNEKFLYKKTLCTFCYAYKTKIKKKISTQNSTKGYNPSSKIFMGQTNNTDRGEKYAITLEDENSI